MALMYPWATKEYLLWQMSIGQVIMYHSLGVEAKNPKPEGALGAANMSEEELRALRDQLRQTYGEIGQ